MKTGRGVVLEVEGDLALVLTPGGEFRWVPLGGRSQVVGRELAFPEPEARVRPLRSPLLVPGLAAACVAVLLLVLVPALISPGPVAAYVSVDINPSLELALDGRGRVVNGEGLDGAGDALLRAAGSLRGLSLDEALLRLLGRAWEQGFLSPEGHNMVVLAATPAGRAGDAIPAWLDPAAWRVEERLREETGLPEGVVVAVRIEAAVREEARAVGLTAGRFAVLLQAQEEGLALEVEDVQGRPLGQAITAAGGSPAGLAADAARETAMTALVEKFKERNRPLPPGREREPDEGGDAGDGPPAGIPGEAGDNGGPPAPPPGQVKDPGPPELPPGQIKDPGPPELPPGQVKDPGPPELPPGQAKDPGPPELPPGQAKDAGPPELPPGQSRAPGTPSPPAWAEGGDASDGQDGNGEPDPDERSSRGKGRNGGEDWVPPGQAKKDSRVR
ncbi:MAG: hypothetical protein RDU89_05830 [bacterium]|nr:hypothetical protein [bacterium]